MRRPFVVAGAVASLAAAGAFRLPVRRAGCRRRRRSRRPARGCVDVVGAATAAGSGAVRAGRPCSLLPGPAGACASPLVPRRAPVLLRAACRGAGRRLAACRRGCVAPSPPAVGRCLAPSAFAALPVGASAATCRSRPARRRLPRRAAVCSTAGPSGRRRPAASEPARGRAGVGCAGAATAARAGGRGDAAGAPAWPASACRCTADAWRRAEGVPRAAYGDAAWPGATRAAARPATACERRLDGACARCCWTGAAATTVLALTTATVAATFAAAPPPSEQRLEAGERCCRDRRRGRPALRLGRLLEPARERAPRAEDQRLDGGLRELELLGDLAVGEPCHSRSRIARRWFSGICSRTSCRPISSSARRDGAGVSSSTTSKSVGDSIRPRRQRRAAAREADVVRDLEEPRRLELRHDAALDPAERVQEGALDGVLGLLARAELVQAVAEDLVRVLLVERAREVRLGRRRPFDAAARPMDGTAAKSLPRRDEPELPALWARFAAGQPISE